MNSAGCSILLRDLQSSGRDEAAGTEDEFHSALLENFEMKIDGVGHHPPLAFTHSGHIDSKAVDRDAELLTPAHVRGDLCTMNDVFTRQAGDVVTRASDVFALDQGDSLSLLRGRPCSHLRSCAEAEHYQVVLFRIRLLRQL